jgi:hypothetical protein
VERTERKHPLAYDVAGFIVNLLFAVYLLVLVPRHPFLILGPGVLYLKSLPFVVSPVWHASYWLFTGAVGVQLALHLARIFATRTWQREGLDVAEKAMGIVLTAIVFRVHEYVLAAPWADLARYQPVADQVNRSILLGLRIVLMIQAIQLLWKLGQILLDRWQGRCSFSKAA